MVKFDDYFNLDRISPWDTLVSFKNGNPVGVFSMEVDGFWFFEPRFDPDHGWINNVILGLLADRLDEMNAAWEEELGKYLEEDLKKNLGNGA